MKFKNLKIDDWKQFSSLDIAFHDRLTVLTGANGSGKTTILHMLARCLGWNFQELATPRKDEKTGIIRFISSLFRKRVEEDTRLVIGSLLYSDGNITELTIPYDARSAKYNTVFKSQDYTGYQYPITSQYFQVPNSAFDINAKSNKETGL